MRFPIEDDYLTERAALVATVESLPPGEFDHGRTLCDEWAPRDVVAHLIGVDAAFVEYLKAYGRVGRGNAAILAA